MDYVEPGRIIRLGAHDRIVLGYLKSCWRETMLVRGAFLDFAKSGVALAPGGIYRA